VTKVPKMAQNMAIMSRNRGFSKTTPARWFSGKNKQNDRIIVAIF